jgi:hypothetical protein
MLILATACSRPRQRSGIDGGQDPWSCHVDAYDSLDHFALSPDGFTVSFLGKKAGKWEFVMSSGWKWKVSENATIKSGDDTGRTITLSPDGARAAIVYSRVSHWRDSGPRPQREDSGGQWFVNIDHHIFGGFDPDFKPAVHFSPDGKQFGFPFKKLGQYYVQVVDTTFGPYDRADLAITRDGEIVLGYLKQNRACIESVFRPAPRSD